MKKLILFIIIIASLSCNTNRQATTGSQVGLLNLTHYYLKNSVSLNSNYNGMVIANENDFETLFYAENPAGNTVSTPDFKGQLVVALALNRNGNDKMVFAKAEITKNAINIYGKQGTVQSENDSPVAVATVPKYSDAKKVNFFIDGELVKTISVSFKKADAYTSRNHENQTIAKKDVRKPMTII